MTTATFFTRDFGRDGARPALATLIRHPLWHRFAATLLPVLAGALALMVAATTLAAAGLAGKLPALFLLAGGFVWFALALDSGRATVLIPAAINLAVMLAGGWTVIAQGTSVGPLYGLHWLILGATALAARPGSAPERAWAGAELAALTLLIPSL